MTWLYVSCSLLASCSLHEIHISLHQPAEIVGLEIRAPANALSTCI
jgi:hypothetical protein